MTWVAASTPREPMARRNVCGEGEGVPEERWISSTFLRNPHRGRGGISLLEDVAQRLGPPLEIGENALLVALLVVGGAGIGIVHPVTQGVIEEHRDLTGSGGDGLGLADTR